MSPTSDTEVRTEARELDAAHHFPLYKRYPITLVRGRGAVVTDDEGRDYIDALAGIAVNSVGHCHPKVVEAIQQQAERLIHVSNLYYTEPQAKLAQRLTQWSGMERVFFTNSGTEAVEAAIKMARRRAHKQGRKGRILAFDGCFHGRSAGPLSAGSDEQKAPFEPLLEGFERLAFLDMEAVERELAKGDVIGVLLEPVQGEGGVHVASDAALRSLRELTEKHDALLILDEIQCGVGRTGLPFAFQHAGITPDIVTIAKALGGGVPIGAVLATEAAAKIFEPGDHGTTFGGNALACAAALASLEVMEQEQLPERAAELGEYMMERLRAAQQSHGSIREVRGRGLMVGVELDFGGKELVVQMLERGVLANCTAERVIRFLPPLVIERKQIDEVVDTFLDVLGQAEERETNG